MKLLPAVLTSCALGLSLPAGAGVVVVVGASSGVGSLNETDVARVFLGKTKVLPGLNGAAVPVDQGAGSGPRKTFYDKVIKKDESQLRSYWSQLLFTGKGSPPQDVGDSSAVKKLLASNPNLIGYMDSSLVDGSVRVVYRVD